jgi:hypothetical protein
MSSQGKPIRKIDRKEEKLYEPIKNCLNIMFNRYVEKDVEAENKKVDKLQREPSSIFDIYEKDIYLEITANGHFLIF